MDEEFISWILIIFKTKIKLQMKNIRKDNLK